MHRQGDKWQLACFHGPWGQNTCQPSDNSSSRSCASLDVHGKPGCGRSVSSDQVSIHKEPQPVLRSTVWVPWKGAFEPGDKAMREHASYLEPKIRTLSDRLFDKRSGSPTGTPRTGHESLPARLNPFRLAYLICKPSR